MKARWLVEVAITSLGMLFVAACATGSSQIGNGDGGAGGDGWGGPASSSSSSSSGNAGAGGGSSSNGAGGAAASSASSSASSASSASSSSGGVCPDMPCKLVSPQCGCTAGQMCTIDGTGTRMCATAGTVAIGQTCGTGNNCAPGGLCTSSASSMIFTCSKFCSIDTDCTPPSGLCVVKLSDGSGGQIPGVALCSESCDPIANTGCPVAGTSCQLLKESTGQKRLYTQCTASGSGTQGASCTNNLNCAPTYGCFNTGTSQCVKYCKIGGAACPGSLTCNSLGTLGATEYGVCL